MPTDSGNYEALKIFYMKSLASHLYRSTILKKERIIILLCYVMSYADKLAYLTKPHVKYRYISFIFIWTQTTMY